MTTPITVKGITSLPRDFQALATIGSFYAPPKHLVQELTIDQVLYGFGNTSGWGFGLTFCTTVGITYQAEV
eukprot:8797155-Ditylum_brightwellii.AAC.1